MRNYVIINGTSSSELTGLLIQELPPISKPKMRTKTETIDGRPGDIITKLGYSAYDKDIEIGLYGNYDVDRVIAFFETEGTVIFSNEPDKYYNFAMVDDVDYKRLVRWKTAKVSLHCQPFKYKVDEVPIETSQSGDITVNNAGNMVARPKLTIYGTGDISISLNGNQIFSIVMGDNEYIEIDTEEMNAYMGGVLLNRSVTGDYSSFILDPGANTVSITGSVTSVTIERYSRWL